MSDSLSRVCCVRRLISLLLSKADKPARVVLISVTFLFYCSEMQNSSQNPACSFNASESTALRAPEVNSRHQRKPQRSTGAIQVLSTMLLSSAIAAMVYQNGTSAESDVRDDITDQKGAGTCSQHRAELGHFS